MDLLDLPPEVFGRVVMHLVTSSGILQAWEHRRVCRTFRRAIEFETLANQPTRAFLHAREASARSILRNNTALYLSYRMTAVKDAYSFLPLFMKRICDTVCSELPHGDYQTRRKYARILCKLLVNRRSDVQGLITTKTPETSAKFTSITPLFQEDVSSNNITAAAAVGDLQALRKALGDKPDDVWENSPAFGWPLVVAAAGNHLEIVRTIVKYFEVNQHRTHTNYHQPQFHAAVGVALRCDVHNTIALLLLQVLHAYGSPVRNNTLESWIQMATDMRDSRIINQVLALRRVLFMGPGDQFRALCNNEDITAIRVFIDEGLVPLRCSTSAECADTPIQAAVRSRRPKVVEEILKMGANPNGDYAPSARDRPLWIAISNKDKATVRVLLRHGANPELVLEFWKKQAAAYRDARHAIGIMLIEAKHKQKYYVCSTTPLTQFAADAVDLVSPQDTEEPTPMELE